MNISLILTGTIDPSVFGNTNVKLTDVDKRLRQYEAAIEFYLKETKVKKLVFVENSGYEFNGDKYIDMADSLGKQFEFLQIFTDYERTVLLGKSYGEGDCIEQGVMKSILLQNEKCFYKVTGRIIVSNFNKLCNQDEKSSFIFRSDLKKCYTVFFKMNIDDFKRFFIGSKNQCDEKCDIDIETVYYNVCKNNDINLGEFRSYPRYDGIIGTINVPYNDRRSVLFIKDILMKIGMYSINGNRLLMDIMARVKVKVIKKRKV